MPVTPEKATRCNKPPWSQHVVGWFPSRMEAKIARVAAFPASVLVTGPSGTGKELVARALHAQSPRSAGPFIPVDCASVTAELMASQLFGHVEGAFTGANCAALGCFRAAQGGTLFLDEIGEMEMSLQSKLLRVLQERVVVPVGSYEGVPIDVRVVAATNRDLKCEVKAGRFRQDLYFRLNVVQVRTQPLASRREEIPPLVRYFLTRLADEGFPKKTVSPGATDALIEFNWPGNVRQLLNVLQQAMIHCEQPVIARPIVEELLREANMTAVDAGTESPYQMITESLSGAPTQLSMSDTNQDWKTLQSLEREHIVATLEHTYHNRSAAARLLGISRQSLLRKIDKLNIATDLGG